MRRQWLCFGLVGILLFGVGSSSSAARHRSGLVSPRGRSVRVSVPPRQRLRRVTPLPESLELPRLMAPLPESLNFPRPVTPGSPAQISAASAILLDARTGEVLFEQNADEPRPPASTTKILTALVILEQGQLEDTVAVSQRAARVGGYRLGLRPGQRISLQDLLAAILIRSANDAAVAAAEHVGGGMAGFVALMNAKARELRMLHSRFENPHGLDEPGHYTTARDMALLAREAMEDPYFARLVRTRETSVTVWGPGRRRLLRRVRTIQSHNKLLGRLEGADGIKTGYTDAAGQCLVASASRGDQRMIAVLLKDPQRWTDAATLLELGFEAAGGAALPVGAPWRATGVGGGRG